jgi:putative lipoic acid-binding regulatory protein
MSMAPEPESLIEYPCEFPIKVLGRTQAGFAQAVLEIVRAHAPDFDGATMGMKTSKRGKYLSVTCVVRATSRNQLDELYRALCDHPMVVMVL